MGKTKKNNGTTILILMCLAIFTSVYTQYQLPSIAGKLTEAFGLSATQFSSIFSAPMIPTILFSIVAGLLVDKVGVKPVIAAGALISALGAILRVWSTNYLMLFFCMILSGFLPTMLNANSGKVFSQYYPPEKIGSMVGIFSAASTLAMAVGTATTAMIPNIKTAFSISAIFVAVSAAGILIFWRSPAKSAEVKEMDAGPVQVSMRECLRASLKSKNVWLIGLVLAMNMSAVMALNTFLPTALVSRGVDSVSAGYYSSVVMLGNIVAAIVVPVISMKTRKTKLIISVSTVIGGLGVALAWLLPPGILMVLAMFITGLAMSGLMPLLMSMPVQLPEIGSAYAGTAGGIVVTVEMLCAVVLPTYILTPLVGDDLPVFFVLSGGLLVIGFVLSLFLPN